MTALTMLPGPVASDPKTQTLLVRGWSRSASATARSQKHKISGPHEWELLSQLLTSPIVSCGVVASSERGAHNYRALRRDTRPKTDKSRPAGLRPSPNAARFHNRRGSRLVFWPGCSKVRGGPRPVADNMLREPHRRAGRGLIICGPALFLAHAHMAIVGDPCSRTRGFLGETVKTPRLTGRGEIKGQHPRKTESPKRSTLVSTQFVSVRL
jgi:hypothetical protein